MRYPDIIYLSPNWVESINEVQAQIEPNKWVPARPLGFQSLRTRIRAAWLVWTGKADALIWPGQ
jgi:hypothetical protein